MKLDGYGVVQSQLPTQNLRKFSLYKDIYMAEVGQTYWKESDFEVSPKMSLKERTSFHVVSFVFNDYLGLSRFLPPCLAAALKSLKLI